MTLPYKLILGDCLEQMALLPDGICDAIIADIPYGTTQCKWDAIIPFKPMWEHLKRLLRKDGAIVFTGSQPFTSALIMSNPTWFKWEDIWDKVIITGHLNAKRQPLRRHENLLVFGDGSITYNPQMTRRDKVRSVKYNTQRLYGNGEDSAYGSRNGSTDGEYTEKYPTSIVTISNADRTERAHPTQKPLALMDYLVRTYSNPGELILDFTMGTCTTGIAALTAGRKFIGIDNDANYYRISQERMFETQLQLETGNSVIS